MRWARGSRGKEVLGKGRIRAEIVVGIEVFVVY